MKVGHTILILLLVIVVNGCTVGEKVSEVDMEGLSQKEIQTYIDSQFTLALEKCNNNPSNIKNYKVKTTFWDVCENEDKVQIIQIKSLFDSCHREEVYFEKEGDLVYAFESVIHFTIDPFSETHWSCSYYMGKGKLIYYESQGHGKTEDDSWEAESILELYKKRLEELEGLRN